MASLTTGVKVTSTIAVLGAGAIGVGIASYLQRDGHRVYLIDEMEPGSGCSWGNAGLIQCGSVVPVATPGTLRALPHMLLDRDQPLVVRWQHLATLAPYLLRFLQETSPRRSMANARALASIIPGAYDAYRPLIEDAGLQDMVRKNGELHVYTTDTGFDAARSSHAIRRELGVRVDTLDAGQTRELEPSLSARVRHGIFLPDAYQTVDPGLFVKRLAQAFVARGGMVRRNCVRTITVSPNGNVLIGMDTDGLQVDKAIIAFGAFSKRWVRDLGDPAPLDSERGYHVMLADPRCTLERTVISGEHRFAMSPTAGGIRLAGTAELAAIGAPANFSRARRLAPLAQRLLPALDVAEPTFWMGHRPSTPDSLPVIDRSTRHAQIIYAFGHGHSGLTLGGMTGRIVADMVARREPQIDMRPFRIDRFHR